MFNLPNLDFLQSPQFQAYLQSLRGGGGFGGFKQAYTPSGGVYSGPFGNDTRTPFRTVTGIGQYGNGLNASASQIYEHFSGAQNANGRKYSDHGLKPIDPKTQIQTMSDFNNRGVLAIPEPAVQAMDEAVPPPNPGTNAAYQGLGQIPNIFRFAR